MESTRSAAVCVAVVVAVLDLFLLTASHRIISFPPALYCCTLLMFRAFGSLGGARYWYIGQTLNYLICGTFLLHKTVLRVLPDKQNVEKTQELVLGKINLSMFSGLWYYLRHPFTLFLLVSAGYAGLTVLVWGYLGCGVVPPVEMVDGVHEQWKFGVGTFCLVVNPALCFLTYRIFTCYYTLFRVCLASFLAIAVGAVSGIIFFSIVRSTVILGIAFSAPTVAVCTVFGAWYWVDNDYEEFPSEAKTGAHRVAVPLCFVIAILAACGGGTFIAILENNIGTSPWIGPCIAFCYLYLMITIAATKKWFNTLRFSGTLAFLVFLAAASVAGYLASVTTTLSYSRWSSGRVVYTLMVAVVYTVCLILGLATYKCRDDDWNITWGVRIMFAISLVIGLGMIPAVYIIKEKSTWGIQTIAWACFVLVLHALVAGFMWYRSYHGLLSERGRRVLNIFGTCLFVFIIVAAIVVGVTLEQEWLGISFAFWFLWLSVMWGAVRTELSFMPFFSDRYKPVYVSRFFFPIFTYNARIQALEDATLSAEIVLGGLFALHVYGMATVFIVQPEVLGLSIAGLSLALIGLFILMKLGYSRQIMEGTAEYITAEIISSAYEHASIEFCAFQEIAAQSIVPQMVMTPSSVIHSEQPASVRMGSQRGKKMTWADLQSDRWFILKTFPRSEKWEALAELQLKLNQTFEGTSRFTGHFFLLSVLLARRHRETELHRFRQVIDGWDQNVIENLGAAEMEKLRKQLAEADERRKEAEVQDELAIAELRKEVQRRQELLQLEEQDQALGKDKVEVLDPDESIVEREEADQAGGHYGHQGYYGGQPAYGGHQHHPNQVPAPYGGGGKPLSVVPGQGQPAMPDRSEPTPAAPTGAKADDWILNKAMAEGGWDKDGMYIDTSINPTKFLAGISVNANSVVWKRPREVHRNFHLFKGISGNDVRQGSLGNCWFLSSISVLAENRKKELQEIFCNTDYANRGLYGLKFYKNGKWRQVIIDDRLPYQSQNATTPLFAHSNDTDEFWVSLIEKAYAKMHMSYSAINGGFIAEGLQDLTGGVGMQLRFNTPDIQQKIATGLFWTELMDWAASNYLLGASSHAGSDTNTSPLGIVFGHAYSILAVKQVDGLQMCRMRNPWGQGEWKGDYSDASPKWTTRLKQKLEYTNTDDGQFWITFQDFLEHFRSLHVCRIFPKEEWNQVILMGGWDKHSSGGNPTKPTYGRNPQYSLTVKEGGLFVVVLFKRDDRGTGDNDESPAVNLRVFKTDGQRADARSKLLGSSGTFDYANSVTAEVQLPASKHPYMVVPSTFEVGQNWEFQMRVYSKSKFEFAAFSAPTFPPPGWSTHTLNGAWDENSAGGCIKYPSFANNPQWGIQVSGNKCRVVIVLKQKGTVFPIQLQLADKKGVRITSLYKHEVLGDSGAYAPREDIQLEATLPEASYPYTLIASTFEPDCEAAFDLAVYSERPVKLVSNLQSKKGKHIGAQQVSQDRLEERRQKRQEMNRANSMNQDEDEGGGCTIL